MMRKKDLSLDTVAYETGLSGSGRLHDLFVNIEAMTPGEYKNGGKDLVINYSIKESPFGNYLVASTKSGICKLIFLEEEEDGLAELKEEWQNAKFVNAEDEHQKRVERFFNNALKRNEKISLHLKGTKFQLKVWEALLKIDEGKIVSYSKVAQNIGKSKSVRAVANAIADNPVGYLIPCHRVIRSDGTIGGYHWGSLRKSSMIAWEACQTDLENRN